MIELYTSNTPNGYKASIMLEEIGLPYTVHKIDLTAGDQGKLEFLEINPNGKIPAIVDGALSRRVFESGAILIYLAEKSGRFLPQDPGARTETLAWLFLQAASIGPMLGQLWHFRGVKPAVSYAINRYEKEAYRLYGVLDGQLASHRHMAGDAYTIADIATWPWIRLHQALGLDVAPYPNVRRWLDEIAARPAVQKGITIPA
ncbi:MAG: glutathione binding-like protein [Alphaproteobacteria bacterium]